MTGLDLESFLQLLRADLGAWLSLGVILLLVALMTWTTWGSRRALRKCLVLSVAVHAGLVGYWFSDPSFRIALSAKPPEPAAKKDGIRQIRVTPVPEKAETLAAGPNGGKSTGRLASWDRPIEALAMASPTLRTPRLAATTPLALKRPETALPDAPPPVLSPPEAPAPEARPEGAPEPLAAAVAPVGDEEIAKPEPAPPLADAPTLAPVGDRLRPERPDRPAAPPALARRRPDAPGLPEATSADAPIAPERGADPELAPPLRPGREPFPGSLGPRGDGPGHQGVRTAGGRPGLADAARRPGPRPSRPEAARRAPNPEAPGRP